MATATSRMILVNLPVKDPDSMYARSFQDPDGHQWEVVWMDPNATQS